MEFLVNGKNARSLREGRKKLIENAMEMTLPNLNMSSFPNHKHIFITIKQKELHIVCVPAVAIYIVALATTLARIHSNVFLRQMRSAAQHGKVPRHGVLKQNIKTTLPLFSFS